MSEPFESEPSNLALYRVAVTKCPHLIHFDVNQSPSEGLPILIRHLGFTFMIIRASYKAVEVKLEMAIVSL